MSVSVRRYSLHRCERNHKTSEAFLKCAISWMKNYSGNWQKPTHSFHGHGRWGVVHKCYSNSSSSYNGKTRDTSYYSIDTNLFSTYEEAVSMWEKMNTYCSSSKKCSETCAGKESFIVEVVL